MNGQDILPEATVDDVFLADEDLEDSSLSFCSIVREEEEHPLEDFLPSADNSAKSAESFKIKVLFLKTK